MDLRRDSSVLENHYFQSVFLLIFHGFLYPYSILRFFIPLSDYMSIDECWCLSLELLFCGRMEETMETLWGHWFLKHRHLVPKWHLRIPWLVSSCTLKEVCQPHDSTWDNLRNPIIVVDTFSISSRIASLFQSSVEDPTSTSKVCLRDVGFKTPVPWVQWQQ